MDENTRTFSFLCSLVFCFQIIYYESVFDFKINLLGFSFFFFLRVKQINAKLISEDLNEKVKSSYFCLVLSGYLGEV